MELSRGVCFFCSDPKIITKTTDTVLSNIKLFLNNSTINQDQLNKIRSLVVCPICYHKIHLLVKHNKSISAADKNGTYSCTLCGSLDEVIKVSKWATFDKICSDFPVLTGNVSPVCSACLFFLDTRHFMKEKLISVYPNLRIEVTIPKFDDNVTIHSTPISKKRVKTSKSNLKSISKSTTPVVEKPTLDLSSIKIKPLSKQSPDIKLLETVNQDHKFMNQILIIKLQKANGLLEEVAEFGKLETGTNVTRSRRIRVSEDIKENKESEVNKKTKVIKESDLNNEDKDSEINNESKLIKNIKASRAIKEQQDKESEVNNEDNERDVSNEGKEIKESEVNNEGEESNQINDIEAKRVKKAKSKTKEVRKARSKIIEPLSDSDEDIKVDVKKKQFFKIRLNQKAKKPAKKEIAVKQKIELKKNLVIELIQMNMPEKNIIDEETNVVESEDSIDLELKDDDTSSPAKMDSSEDKMETSGDAKIDSSEDKLETTSTEKMETSGDDNQILPAEENTQTTNEATENLDTSVEEVPTKEKSDENELEAENDSEKSEVIDEKLSASQGQTEEYNKKSNSDSEDADKSESEETEKKNEDRNSDSEETEKNESEEIGIKNEGRNYDSETTEKNESDVDAAETDGTDEYVTKDDIQKDDEEENDEEVPLKSERNSAVDENNVEEITEQNGKDAKNGDDLSEEINNDSQETDNETQETDNETQENYEKTEESANLSRANNTGSTDNLVSSIENNEQVISEIEAVLDTLDSIETNSEADKEDQETSVVTVDSSQDDVDVDTGKRKRSESVSDTNGPEKKKKKVTFSEDVVSDG